ncbi:MAG: hypothetical protein C0501_19975 [Isosphaera sp.]|nr:hypothetical protein [Isosphaera sp.]
MIYSPVVPDAPIDQGDLVEDFVVVLVRSLVPGPTGVPVDFDTRRIVVLTQTCDLANDKTAVVNVAEVQDAQFFVETGILKPADIKGSLRSGRIWGLYFLPADPALGLPEMIVDFRRLHTVKLDLLRSLCVAGKRPGRVQPLYREHLAKHFADTFSRIGLPRPYETL